jgi:hypothetical protein
VIDKGLARHLVSPPIDVDHPRAPAGASVQTFVEGESGVLSDME